MVQFKYAEFGYLYSVYFEMKSIKRSMPHKDLGVMNQTDRSRKHWERGHLQSHFKVSHFKVRRGPMTQLWRLSTFPRKDRQETTRRFRKSSKKNRWRQR